MFGYCSLQTHKSTLALSLSRGMLLWTIQLYKNYPLDPHSAFRNRKWTASTAFGIGVRSKQTLPSALPLARAALLIRIHRLFLFAAYHLDSSTDGNWAFVLSQYVLW